MKKDKITRLHIQCFLKYSLRLLFFGLFIISFFYLSLAFEVYLQQRQANKFACQYIEFNNKKAGKYIYEKDIYFTPQIATYQASAGKIYICINDSISKNLKLDNIHIKAIRKNHGETKIYEVNYSDFKEGWHRTRRPGFDCFAFLAMRLHVDYNNVKFIISGIDLPEPDKNLKIMLRFEGIKRRAVLGEYLFKGLLAMLGFIFVVRVARGSLFSFKLGSAGVVR